MSNRARSWAEEQRTGRASLKQILNQLAEHMNAHGRAFPSITSIVWKTELDRKTVVAGLQELQRKGLIVDTGDRMGRTKQIPVYAFSGFECDALHAQRQLACAGEKGPGIGTLSSSATESQLRGSQVVEDDEEFKATSSNKSSESGTVPISGSLQSATVPVPDGNSPVFSGKQSQKRTTEPSGNLIGTSGARAPARGRARAPEPGPDPSPDAQREALGRAWHRLCLIAFQDCWSTDMDLPELHRRQFVQLPQRLREMVTSAAVPVVARLIDAEFDGHQRAELERGLLRDLVREAWSGIRTIPLSGKVAAA